MKYIITLLIVGLTASSFAQKDFTPGSKRKAFGKIDNRQLRLTGLQIELGPAYTFTSLKTINGDFNDGGTRGNYEIDPKGRFGGYLDIGLAHYLKKASFFNYIDWGLGFKYIGGREKTTVNFTDVGGNTVNSFGQTASFFNGYATARFSLHKIIAPKKWEKVFLDESIGFNVDYRVITDDQASNYHLTYVAPFSPGSQYHKPLVAQLHIGTGVGFKVRKGTNVIVGLRAPILGIYEWNKGNPAQAWFSSKYFPVFLHVKVINLFQKRSKDSCNGVEGNPDDKKKNDEFMMGQ